MNRFIICHRLFVVALIVAVAAILGHSASAGPLSIAMVPVGDPGNAADTTDYGAVAYSYSIGKGDITASQYAAFLNSVAATDTFGLYNSNMASSFAAVGIIQSGTAGSYAYSVTPGHENFPVNYLSWGSAARFANWLQNGQPTGAEGPGTTETGAYALNGATSTAALVAVTRNSGATWFIPTENEWYKAAYYKRGGLNAGYWVYPTQSNIAPINTLPDTGNHANFYDRVGTGNGGYSDPNNYLTSVGAFNLSPGPYGTFDQGGDVFQWNETAVTGTSRGLRGGSFYDLGGSNDLRSSARSIDDPTVEFNDVGFRVASVPEPGSVALLLVGAAAFLGWRICTRNARFT
jgi:formylglycine-generating enzyme